MDSWCHAIASWLMVLQAAGRPATTIRLRRYQLERVAGSFPTCGPWEVSGDALVAFVAAQDWQAETLRSWRSALRGFYGWAAATGRNNCNPALALPVVKPSDPNPRPTPEDVYRDALARADERVRLMLRMAAELGMRRGEVAVAHRRDLERALDGWVLLVHGKGGRLRRVPVDDGLAAAIRRRGFGYLFAGDDHGHLSPHYVGKLVSRVLPPGWAMHSLRHRFATAAHDVDHDLITVQQLLGHASLVTTQRYVLARRDELRRTVAAVARL